MNTWALMFLKIMLDIIELVLGSEIFIPIGIIRQLTSFLLGSSVDPPVAKIVPKPFWIFSSLIWRYLILCQSIPSLPSYSFLLLFFVLFCFNSFFFFSQESRNWTFVKLWNKFSSPVSFPFYCSAFWNLCFKAAFLDGGFEMVSIYFNSEG